MDQLSQLGNVRALQSPLFKCEPAHNPALVYLTRLAPSSRKTILKYLRHIARMLSAGEAGPETFDWSSIRNVHVSAVRAQFAAHRAPKSANMAVSVIKQVLRQAWRMGLIDIDTMNRAIDVPKVPGRRRPAGRDITHGELRAMFDVCADYPPNMGARNAALLAVLYGTGVRRSEAAALQVGDYDPQNGVLIVNHGKGDIERVCILQPSAKAAVWNWLKRRGMADGALFVRIMGHGDKVNPKLARLNDDAIRQIVRRIADDARVIRATPHDFRRTLTGDLFDAGADLSSIMAVLGHQSPASTVRYDRRGFRAHKAAALKIHVPYKPGKRRMR